MEIFWTLKNIKENGYTNEILFLHIKLPFYMNLNTTSKLMQVLEHTHILTPKENSILSPSYFLKVLIWKMSLCKCRIIQPSEKIKKIVSKIKYKNWSQIWNEIVEFKKVFIVFDRMIIIVIVYNFRWNIEVASCISISGSVALLK